MWLKEVLMRKIKYRRKKYFQSLQDPMSACVVSEVFSERLNRWTGFSWNCRITFDLWHQLYNLYSLLFQLLFSYSFVGGFFATFLKSQPYVSVTSGIKITTSDYIKTHPTHFILASVCEVRGLEGNNGGAGRKFSIFLCTQRTKLHWSSLVNH